MHLQNLQSGNVVCGFKGNDLGHWQKLTLFLMKGLIKVRLIDGFVTKLHLGPKIFGMEQDICLYFSE